MKCKENIQLKKKKEQTQSSVRAVYEGSTTEVPQLPPLLPRFSQMVQDKPLRTSWQRKMKERQERKLAKDFARHLEEEKQRRRQVRDHSSKPGSQTTNTYLLRQTLDRHMIGTGV